MIMTKSVPPPLLGERLAGIDRDLPHQLVDRCQLVVAAIGQAADLP